MTIPAPFESGQRLIDGNDLNTQLAKPNWQSVSGIVAAAGGGQANATPLFHGVNEVNTVATAADSVLLPAAVPGKIVVARNATATSMQVFGRGTDTINAAAAATGIAVAANKSILFFCTQTGIWYGLLGA